MVTLAQLKTLYPRALNGHLAAFDANAPALFTQFGIAHTPNRLHFFLAQIGHESGGLSAVEENLNYSAEGLLKTFPTHFTVAQAQQCARHPEMIGNQAYANRNGNGPPASGDGFKYRGRGYIQLTGRANYRAIGHAAGLDLEGKPELAIAPASALQVTCAYWDLNGLNALCDTGSFEKVTRKINGGINGMPDRLNWLDKVRRTLADPPAKQPAADTVRAVQKALLARGFTGVGAADGDLGDHTAAAIRLFRSRNGMPDGLIDAALLAVLGVA